MSLGLDKGFIIVGRLLLTLVVFGAAMLIQDTPASTLEEDLIEAALLLVIGAVGFSLPLLLILYVIEQFKIEHFAAAMFLIPVLIYLFLFAMQQVDLGWHNAIGIFLVFVAVVYYDRKHREPVK